MLIKFIPASFEILTDPEMIQNATKEIEKASRIAYQSLAKLTPESHKSFVKALISKKHESVLEFGPRIDVRFICSRAIANEIVRHRLASFIQESTRYCNYKDEIRVILPLWLQRLIAKNRLVIDMLYEFIEWWKKLDGVLIELEGLPVSSSEDYNLNLNDQNEKEIVRIWMQSTIHSCVHYAQLVRTGIQPQLARDLLPHSLKTELLVSTNIREWRYILKLRTSLPAHPDMRYLMCGLLEKLKSYSPILFDL